MYVYTLTPRLTNKVQYICYLQTSTSICKFYEKLPKQLQFRTLAHKHYESRPLQYYNIGLIASIHKFTTAKSFPKITIFDSEQAMRFT